MKHINILRFYFILIIMLIISSCFNIFSVFTTGEPQNLSNITRLLAIGESQINNMEYEKAYETYTIVLDQSPNNSIALEGASTAYLFWKMPISNIVSIIASASYTNLSLNDFYDVSGVISKNLYKIIDAQGGTNSDEVIPYDDTGINLNFFIFNTLSSIFYLVDTDGDSNVQADTNDLIIIFSDFSFSNTIPIDDMTNLDFVQVIKLLNMINQIIVRIEYFTNNLNRSFYSLSLITNGIVSPDVKATIYTQVMMPIEEYSSQLNEIISMVDILNMDQTDLPIDLGALTNISSITNMLSDAGITNFDDFTNEMASIGITNITNFDNIQQELTNFSPLLTNLAPDLTNLNDLLSNFFGF